MASKRLQENNKFRKRRKHRETLAAVARQFYLRNLSVERPRNISTVNQVTVDHETDLPFESGEGLVGLSFDKTFSTHGVWTATIEQYEPATAIYTCRYEDGYRERLKLKELGKFQIYQKERAHTEEPTEDCFS